jgi:hypothetical protein
MSYQEIEIEVIGHGGKTHKQYININNINYYRPYIDTPAESGKKPKLMTMVYFQGSIKATYVNCSCEDFQRKINKLKSPTINLQ